MPGKWTPPDTQQLVDDYLSGVSVNALAKRHGVARSAVNRVLTEQDVPQRGNADANRVMMAERTPEENRRNSEAAHKAASRPHTFEERCRMAQGRERTKPNVSEAERLLGGWLAERGVSVVSQKAIGPYNCDLAAGAVAVEVFCGGWHMYGSHAARMAERVDYILNEGWALVIVWVDGRYAPIMPEAADYLASLVEQTRGDPALRGEYRVIWGDGKVVPSDRLDHDDLSVKPPRTRARGRRS